MPETTQKTTIQRNKLRFYFEIIFSGIDFGGLFSVIIALKRQREELNNAWQE